MQGLLVEDNSCEVWSADDRVGCCSFQPFDRKLVSVWLAAFGRAFPTFSFGF